MDTHAFCVIYSKYDNGELNLFSPCWQKGNTMSEEKQTTYKGQTDARRRASAKYLRESVEDVRIRVPKGQKSVIKAHADTQGESMNQFVIRAINETMARDNNK